MRKATVGVSAALLLIVLGATCLVVFRVDSRLRAIRQQVSHEGELRFSLTSLPLGTGVHSSTGFEPVAAAIRYSTGTAFAGKLYLAGPGGLAIYIHPNSQPTLLRTGIDLPPAPIVALAAGRLRGESSNSLIAATHGEGVLLFSPDPSAPIQQLRPADPANRDITAILRLASGDLLIGTRRAGLLVFDGKTLRLFQPSFAGVAVTALASDSTGFWVGTRTSGVLHWHGGQLDAIDASSGLPDNQVNDLTADDRGVFVATPLGVAQFIGGHLARVLARGLFARALAVDGSTLLVATVDQGVHEIPLQPHASLNTASGDNTLNVTRFFSAGDTFLAVDDDGLLRHDHDGIWQKVITEPPQLLTDANIAALSFAPDGRLWIGYFDRGVDVLDLGSNRAQHVEDDHVFCINRIVPDSQRHTMDVATANGLVLFDAARQVPQERQVLSHRDGLIADQVTDIAFTSTGMALATPAGITFFTVSGPQSLYSFQGLANNHVYALAAQPSTRLVLAGTLAGISILDDATVRQNVTLKNSGLKRNWITALARVPQPDAPDTWFVGAFGGSVVQMDSAGHITPMDTQAPTAVISPNALLATQQHVFAGSLDDGLLVYSLTAHRWSQVIAGLPSRNVTALAERNGELYIGTENGLVRIAEAGLP